MPSAALPPSWARFRAPYLTRARFRTPYLTRARFRTPYLTRARCGAPTSGMGVRRSTCYARTMLAPPSPRLVCSLAIVLAGLGTAGCNTAELENPPPPPPNTDVCESGGTYCPDASDAEAGGSRDGAIDAPKETSASDASDAGPPDTAPDGDAAKD
jgi:hypothetical protein